MAAVRSFAPVVLFLGAAMASARADTLQGASLRWTTWQYGVGVVPFGSPGTWPSATSSAPAPAASSSSATAAPAPTAAAGTPVDAFVNLGTGPYPQATTLTGGGAQPWYDSAPVVSLYGGVPGAQQQADFTNTVLQRIEGAFQRSGVPVTLTADPTVASAHTLSVVSGTVNPTMTNAIGMTDLGGNGFTFVDNIAKSAQSVDQLETMVANNAVHELTIALGAGENFDKSGNYIDSEKANWSMITSPTASLSPGAVQALLAQNFLVNSDTLYNSQYAQQFAQQIGPQPIPEPTTVAAWALAATAYGLLRRRALRRRG